MSDEDTLRMIRDAYKDLTDEQAAALCKSIRDEACKMAAFRIRSEIERSLMSLSKRFPNYHFAFNGKTIESCEIPF
jgi:DNA polymerase III delta prime subunit